ncbi:MAG TPA: hypothetical protein VLI54_00550 [Bacillota bacterium]|nr:hypothetical protein [Bacillota bacterium]
MDENEKKNMTPRLADSAAPPAQDAHGLAAEQPVEHNQVYGKSMRTIQPLTPGLQAPEQAVPHPALEPVSAAPAPKAELNTPPTPPPASTAATPANVAQTPKRSVYPVPHAHDEPFDPSAPLAAPSPAANTSTYDSEYSRPSQTIVVFLLAAGAGALFFKMLELALEHLPHSLFTCSVVSTLAGTPCNRLWLTIFFICTALFSLVSYAAYTLRQRSFALAFSVAGFTVSLFAYLELNAALNFFGWHILEWLISHRTLNMWVVPAALAGIVAAVVCIISTYLRTKVRLIVSGVLAIIIIASLFSMPGVAHKLYISQTLTTIKNSRQDRVEQITKSSVPLYIPKNYSGPLKLIRAHDSGSVSSTVAPYFSLSYTLASADPEPNDVTVIIYKGTDMHFSPPDDCGNNTPWAPDRAHPLACKNVLVSAKGRKIYTDAYGLQNNRPNQYYISMGAYVVGLSDFNRPGQQVSPLTLQLVGQFADSLEPLSGNDLTQFVNKYFIL